MYLSRLEIFGFKSFAQKTVFQFSDGLTAIIGPNGCGKSNIVDAIRWVLGEQRPSVLRADRMENLIFNGTATRKPLNVAEVSIFIENTKNILPSEYSEIKITRRLYRSGESEYLINNQPVRLMDIINLFADTGMGADAYSVIELKMVEQILSDNAEERRRLFEEAAGIKKYKIRRKSAQRKLETTRQELQRLEDIISEVQKNVNSLARQVGKARRYHALKNALVENEILLAQIKILSYQQELEPLREEFQQVSKTRNGLGSEVQLLESKLEAIQAKATDLDKDYKEIAIQLHEQNEKIADLNRDLQVKKQRKEALEETIVHLQEEIHQLTHKLQKLEREQDQLEKEKKENEHQLQKAQAEYRKLENQRTLIEQTLEEKRQAYQAFVQTHMKEIEENAALQEEVQRYRLEKESLNQELAQKKKALAELQKSLQTVSAEIAELTEKLEQLKSQHQKATEAVRMKQLEIETHEQRVRELNEDRNRLLGEQEKLKNQKKFLEQLIYQYQGFSESVQKIMAQKGHFQGVVETLVNLIEIDDDYLPAVESFLGDLVNMLVVENLETTREIVKQLREKPNGRLTILPLALLKENKPSVSRIGTNGKFIPLNQVIRFNSHIEPSLRQLFENVFFVENLDLAIELHEQFPEVTFVTPEGEILEPRGHITLGNLDSGSGLLSRRKELENVQQALEDLHQKQTSLEDELADKKTSIETCKSQLTNLEKEKEKLFLQTVELEKILNQKNYEKAQIEKNLESTQKALEAISESLQVFESKSMQLQPDEQLFQQKVQAYKEQEAILQEELSQLETQLRELSQSTQESQIRYLNLLSREKELNQKGEFLHSTIQETRVNIKQREEQITKTREQISQLEAELHQLEAEIEKYSISRESIENRKEQIEKAYQNQRADIEMMETELKKKHRLLNQARERLQQLELRIRELEVKMESLVDHVRQSFGQEMEPLSPDQLQANVTASQVQEEIEKIRQKLNSLGEVNPLAIKEHQQEKERLTFLTSQRDDLLAAEEQLLETINKLNRTARQLFLNTFEKVRGNFRKVFKEFFDWGEADLVLVDSKDPLEANIDVHVTLKGKKLRTLSLLSAGEKTLTAISLLFAIYLVKPSPFCILDEVDAPLDDVNIVRFTQALKRFTKDTQFILVTHNKKTMEAAQAMYGITMVDQGVSQVISVKLT